MTKYCRGDDISRHDGCDGEYCPCDCHTPPYAVCNAISLYMSGIGCDLPVGHDGYHLDLKDRLEWRDFE